MPLSDTPIRAAKPTEKPYKLPDEKGLFLLVCPSGSKYWRQKYRYGGKEKMLAHGVYPDISLKEARERRDAARKLLANDIDPGENKKVQKAAKLERSANSFEVIAREWFAKHKPNWAISHADKIIARLENDIFPWLGGKPIAEITAPDILAALRRIESRGALDTAHRALQNCGQVFRYAVATGRVTRDPCGDLRGALPPARPGHFAAITEPLKIAELLRAIDDVPAGLVVKSALKLSPLLFVRPGELRTARWADINMEKAEWQYFVSKTKTDHLVPLSSQAIAILKELYPLTGQGEYVFPGARSRNSPMSGMAVNVALRRAGYNTREEQTGHGFRAMARTILHQELGIAPEIIEHQLAHRVPDALGTAYNRTKFLKDRRVMMQTWADYLDKIKSGADVIQLNGEAA
ncbi:MAG: integrase family protein [Proteobacteria bacterium]|nr:integrase family protein [Pseudomonadota bacterium]